ncbi:MAG: hypothetical protein HPY54_07125 [Chthonomonadetes bacterium]|nr:hypothetical protein [Chthonomonadetes bacterium]
MEHWSQDLQLVATRPDVAQFQQWLATCMLYAQTGVMPAVQVYPHNTRQPLLRGIIWKGMQVWVPDRALEEIPPYPLALLALRNYMEAKARQKLIWRSIALTALILFTVPTVIYEMTRNLPEEWSRWLFHLLVLLPIHYVWSWIQHIAAQIDRQVVQGVGQTDAFLQGMEAAIKIDLKVGVADKEITSQMARLNTLRRELGYPEVERGDLFPSPAEGDGDGEHLPPAIDKGEFLRRHPPDEYKKVDRIEI